MRTILDKVYAFAGAVSGLSIVIICLVILTRVIGRWFGIVIPSSDDFAGYFLASASFLALAYTFRNGAHIRVSLFTSRLSKATLLWLERLVLTIAALLVIFLAYQLTYMVWESWAFDEVTSGYIPMPLWAVQLPMSVGAVIFTIAVIDSAICSWLFGTPIPKSAEEELAESDTIEMPTSVRNNHE